MNLRFSFKGYYHVFLLVVIFLFGILDLAVTFGASENFGWLGLHG